MRWSVLLTIVAATFLWISYQYQSELVFQGAVSNSVILELQKARDHFVETHSPVTRASLEYLEQFKVSQDLLSPDSILPKTHRYPLEQIRLLYHGMKTCRWSKFDMHHLHPHLRKAVIWQQFLCGQVPELPEIFFSIPPLMHPMGSSYVYLAYKTEISVFKDSKWLERHRSRLHVNELSLLPDAVKLTAMQSIFASLSPEELLNIQHRESAVLGDDYVFFREEGSVGEDSSPFSVYKVFQRDEFEKFLSSTRFSIQKVGNSYSVFQQGNMAWNINSSYLNSRSQRYRILAIVSILLLIGNLIWIAAGQIQRKIKEQRERLFVLQTLTHELRTPVAGMQLNLEPFRAQFDKMDEEGQKAFFRIADSLRRLNRVIEASTQYLRSDRRHSDVKFHYENVEMIGDYLDSICCDYENEVVLVSSENEVSFPIDVYWLGMCVKNLIENALKHGKKPVRVSYGLNHKGALFIEVEDQGNISLGELESLTQAFARRSANDGIGLGLTLVKRITGQMGGKLEFDACPTRVRMVMKRRKS
jgi:signal transduction histidine kinase